MRLLRLSEHIIEPASNSVHYWVNILLLIV